MFGACLRAPSVRFVLVCLLCACGQSMAQDTASEIRPELGIYVQLGQMVRIQSTNVFRGNLTRDDWLAELTFYVETALKPMIRRRLRDHPDVYRNRYLTFRGGYRRRI